MSYLNYLDAIPSLARYLFEKINCEYLISWWHIQQFGHFENDFLEILILI